MSFFCYNNNGDNMKNKIIIISIIVLLIIFLVIGSLLGYRAYQQWRIANAEIIVELNDNLEIDVFSDVKLSSLIKSINGELVKDFSINTKKVGKQAVKFKYVNTDDIEVSYTFEIDVVDKVAPLIFSSKSFSVTKGYTGNLEEELFCGDNYDNDPKCEIIGHYDYNVAGSYSVAFLGTDSSGNVSRTDFTLNVKELIGGSSGSSGGSSSYINFSDVVNEHKTFKTSIGLDVSRWQGDIDFQKVKDAGVEFVFIRVGSQRGVNGEYFIDPKFERNIKGFKEVGIPVGIYFYSYANSKDNAKKEAKWIIEQLKPYKIDLPVVFDWENWSFYQEFNLSFYNITEIAKTYLKELEKAGYKGMLYSSKYYLENVWFDHKYPVWLAHYTNKTNYQGEYQVWQMCNNGRIPGINGDVDINIMYN